MLAKLSWNLPWEYWYKSWITFYIWYTAMQVLHCYQLMISSQYISTQQYWNHFLCSSFSESLYYKQLRISENIIILVLASLGLNDLPFWLTCCSDCFYCLSHFGKIFLCPIPQGQPQCALNKSTVRKSHQLLVQFLLRLYCSTVKPSLMQSSIFLVLGYPFGHKYLNMLICLNCIHLSLMIVDIYLQFVAICQGHFIQDINELRYQNFKQCSHTEPSSSCNRLWINSSAVSHVNICFNVQ